MSIEASVGRKISRNKSSFADRIANDKEGSEIRKRGARMTEITIPINGEPDGPAVLLSLENTPRGNLRFRHRGTIFAR